MKSKLKINSGIVLREIIIMLPPRANVVNIALNEVRSNNVSLTF